MDRLSVFGLGYMGLVFGVCLASRGFEVVGVDVDERRVEEVNGGVPPFFEPQLEELLSRAVTEGRLRATTDCREAVVETDASFVCVGTPSLPSGAADLRFVRSALAAIGEAMSYKNSWHLVVVRSTVPPGTCDSLAKPLLEEVSGKPAGEGFGLCMNPEFLREGSAVSDVFGAGRVVIGELDERSGDALEALYRVFYGGSMPRVVRTSLVNAELVKYATNAFLAVKASFANAVACLCERMPGADAEAVMEAVGLDPRIERSFLRVGVGFGGSCLPKDLRALAVKAGELGCCSALFEAALEVNEGRIYRVVELAEELVGSLKGRRVAVLGLSFKPGTDDVRESPSLKVVRKLLEEGAEVVVYDPAAMGNARKVLGDAVEYAGSALDCLKGADCAILVTEWEEFRRLKPRDFESLMRTPALVDGRRVYDAESFSKRLRFAAIGLHSRR